jgi:hypothetical protein
MTRKIKNLHEMTLKELVEAWGADDLPDEISGQDLQYLLWAALAKDIERIKAVSPSSPKASDK